MSSARFRPGATWPLDADTVRAYCSPVRQFLAWLKPTPDPQGEATNERPS